MSPFLKLVILVSVLVIAFFILLLFKVISFNNSPERAPKEINRFGAVAENQETDRNEITYRFRTIPINRHHDRTRTKRSLIDLNEKDTGQYDLRFDRICDSVRSGFCFREGIRMGEATYDPQKMVTLATQGIIEDLKHVPNLCRRWKGPMSVALYAPGMDFYNGLHGIDFVRACNPCVRRWVTWHIIFDYEHTPDVPEPNEWYHDCDTPPDMPKTAYGVKHNLTFPINVARNVARLNALTSFVFETDVDLSPSRHIITRILDLVRRRKQIITSEIEMFVLRRNTSTREAFVLPMFEVRSGVKLPNMKRGLLNMYNKGDAFIKHNCNEAYCQSEPDLDEWFKQGKYPKDLNVFKTLRNDPKQNLGFWEPVFISRKDYPLYDERFRGTGDTNRIQVLKEMCYLQYDFHILDNAFVVRTYGPRSLEERLIRQDHPEDNLNLLVQLRMDWADKYGKDNTCH